jgi:hypothetical protein
VIAIGTFPYALRAVAIPWSPDQDNKVKPILEEKRVAKTNQKYTLRREKRTVLLMVFIAVSTCLFFPKKRVSGTAYYHQGNTKFTMEERIVHGVKLLVVLRVIIMKLWS